MTNVESEVIEIIAKQTSEDRSKVTRDAKLEDLRLESLDVVEIIFALEETFDITIPYNANDPGAAGASFETVENVVAAVEDLIVASEATG